MAGPLHDAIACHAVADGPMAATPPTFSFTNYNGPRMYCVLRTPQFTVALCFSLPTSPQLLPVVSCILSVFFSSIVSLLC